MSVQNRGDLNIAPLILGGNPLIKEAETILQEATRTVVLAQFTLMGKVAASGKWTPYTNASLTATDGTQIPQGIYLGDDIAAASLVAGDVTGQILVADAIVDMNQLVYGKGPTGALATITKDSVATTATAQTMRVEDILRNYAHIYLQQNQAISAVEN